MPKKQIVKRSKRIIAAPKNCAFCEAGKEPTFLDTKSLEKFVTERGKIISRVRTGLCARHQRRVTTAIKHARHLALMPFTARVV
ncbi:MAG TPA: 30S ribosomal protein S18 [Candidatus Saccharimonadales bacterium]|nr:30S ribosomal protein S18 [Candidatus Saccharimonadales bacterium]